MIQVNFVAWQKLQGDYERKAIEAIYGDWG